MILAVLFIGLAIVYVVRGLVARGNSTAKRYNVGRQEARISMLGAWLFAALFGLIGVVLLAIGGVGVIPDNSAAFEPSVLETPAASDEPIQLPETTDSIPLPTQSLPETALEPTLTPTQTPTALPPAQLGPPPTFTPVVDGVATQTIPLTPTPVADDSRTARVVSPNGLYLRDAPGGEIVELVPNEAVLRILEGEQTVDDIVWWFVRSAAGNEGWVAAAFLIEE